MEVPPGQKQFQCENCQAAIMVPVDLPATSAPCPVCQQITTSPPLPEKPPVAPATPAPAEMAQPAPTHDAYEESRSGGAGMLWSLAALTFLGLLAGGFFLFSKYRVIGDPVEGGTSNQPSAVSIDRPVFDGVEERALKILQNFLSAKTVEERSKYVIGKEKTIPAMKAYYGSGELDDSDLKVDYFSEWAMAKADTDRGIYLLEYDRPKQFKMGDLFIPITELKTQLTLKEPDLNTKSKALRGNFQMEADRARVYLKLANDDLLIDWHTFVQTKNRLFRDFINHPVAGLQKEFRLFIGEAVTTVLLADPSVREYRLVDPAHSDEDVAIATVQRDSEVGRILETIAWTDIQGKKENGRSITCVVGWSNDPDPVLEITKVICWEFLGVGGTPANLIAQDR